jgi:hypothetical protein
MSGIIATAKRAFAVAKIATANRSHVSVSE